MGVSSLKNKIANLWLGKGEMRLYQTKTLSFLNFDLLFFVVGYFNDPPKN